MVLRFERRCPPKNTLLALKSKDLPPSKFWAGYVAAEKTVTKINLSMSKIKIVPIGMVTEKQCILEEISKVNVVSAWVDEIR